MAGILQDPVLVDGQDEPLYEPEAPTYQEPEYRDWDGSNSRVISGPIGDTKFSGMRFTTWQAAQEHVREWSRIRDKKVYQFWTIPGRWFARVAR